MDQGGREREGETERRSRSSINRPSAPRPLPLIPRSLPPPPFFKLVFALSKLMSLGFQVMFFIAIIGTS